MNFDEVNVLVGIFDKAKVEAEDIALDFNCFPLNYEILF